MIANKQKLQPVLIFFENIDKMKRFIIHCKNNTNYKVDTFNIIDASTNNLYDAVSKAMFSNQISLLDRVFGRGTDFITHDKRIS